LRCPRARPLTSARIRLAGHVFTLKRVGMAAIAALFLSSFEVANADEEKEERLRGRFRLTIVGRMV
jgi:hypothetical protein